MKGFILVSLKQCDEKKMLDQLKSLPEVKNAYILFGEWDLIIEVEINNPEDFGTFVMEKIRSLTSVKLTSSLIVARK